MKREDRLTDKQIRAAEAGEKSRLLWDGGGLYVEIVPTGYKRFRYKYQMDGRERRMTIGPYPTVSLKEARLARDEARRKVRLGLDPIVERQEGRRARRLSAAVTVKAVTEEWVAQQASWTEAYRGDVRRAFEQHLFPAIGSLPIKEVTPKMLQLQVIKPLTDRGRAETARRIRQRLNLIWNHALLTERATFNAALPIKGTIEVPAAKNFASVSEDALPELLVAVRAYGNRLVEHAVLLQILTATRPGETRGALWEEFDLDRSLWTIPAARMKRGEQRGDHLVPLSTQAVRVLRSLQAFAGQGPVLFRSRSRWNAPMSEGVVLMAFGRTGFGHVTAHGMRSLFSTACHEHGHESHIIELCQAHVDTNAIRATYNKALYLPQRRKLLQWWGDRVEGLCDAYTGPRSLLPIFPGGSVTGGC